MSRVLFSTSFRRIRRYDARHSVMQTLASLLALLSPVGLSGCANSLFKVSTLPEQYAATPIRDFSRVDLTRFSQPGVDGHRILPGDRLRIRVNTGAWGEEAEQVWTVGVDASGQVALPNIGPVQVAGYTQSEAEQSIVQTSLQRDVYRTPAIDVQVAEREMRSIVVLGAVSQPGAQSIREPQFTLADVIARAGGLTPEASGQISISGVAPQAGSPLGNLSDPGARTIDLYQSSEEELARIVLPAGGVVMVEKAQPRRVQVIGVIANRTIEMPPGKNLRLLDVLAMAGGPSYSNWILDKVHIIRQVPGSDETIRIKASIRAAKQSAGENILLAANDIVSVEENAMTFTLSTIQSLFAVGTSGARLATF